jgi:hypothetical protein
MGLAKTCVSVIAWRPFFFVIARRPEADEAI